MKIYILLLILFFVPSKCTKEDFYSSVKKQLGEYGQYAQRKFGEANLAYKAALPDERLNAEEWVTVIRENRTITSELEVSKYIKDYAPKELHTPLQNTFITLVDKTSVAVAFAIIAGLSILAGSLAMKTIVDLLDVAIKTPLKALRSIYRRLKNNNKKV